MLRFVCFWRSKGIIYLHRKKDPRRFHG